MGNSMQVLLLVGLMAGGLGIYHVLVASDSEPAPLVTPVADDDGDLARRVAALEDREPPLQGSLDSSDLWQRVRDIESRLDALEQRRKAPGADDPTTPDTDAKGAGGLASDLVADAEGEAGDALKKRVDRLVEDAMGARMRNRMSGRLDRTLGELGVELDDEQRKKLEDAMAVRMQETRKILRSGREAGLSREEVGEQIAKVSATFTETLSSFMSATDAQAITEATAGPPGGGPPRGPGR
ncbi:MAG: hypothetical protein QNJ98_00145 [Planctomycetota bacterium]|nr:hypothetical protein [Planctomycetota bacterium]